MNIMEIQAKIDEAEQQIRDLVAAEQLEDAYKAEGKLAQLREDMAHAVKALEEENKAMKASVAEVVEDEAPKSLFAQAFGDEKDFAGLQPGMTGTAFFNAATVLPMPKTTSTELPEYIKAPTNFLDTLPKGTADGAEQFFTAPVLTNNAAEWVSGDKPESALEWGENTANPGTVAHWIPIHKQMVRRYKVLEQRTGSALLAGVDMKADALAIRGDNPNGIVGVVNTTGILTHTMDTADKKNLRDNLVMMANKVRIASGYQATHVALSPNAIEALQFAKDANDNYLFPDLKAGGTIAGMTVVEDINMTAEGKETALVYYNGGAEWKVADALELEVGTTDKQFIQNAYTLLAEETALLRVDVPAAFAYCADLGL